MSIYQHFREEEHPFIDQVLSWRETVERTYQAKLTDFLDPPEQQIVSSLIGTKLSDVQLAFQDTGEQEERKRALIAPFYEEITETSFQLSLLDRKSTRLNSSHVSISYAVFCLKKKKNNKR